MRKKIDLEAFHSAAASQSRHHWLDGQIILTSSKSASQCGMVVIAEGGSFRGRSCSCDSFLNAHPVFSFASLEGEIKAPEGSSTMVALSLKICVRQCNVVKTMQFEPSTAVYDACRVIRERVPEAQTGQGQSRANLGPTLAPLNHRLHISAVTRRDA